jgi:hypothetical protein
MMRWSFLVSFLFTGILRGQAGHGTGPEYPSGCEKGWIIGQVKAELKICTAAGQYLPAVIQQLARLEVLSRKNAEQERKIAGFVKKINDTGTLLGSRVDELADSVSRLLQNSQTRTDTQLVRDIETLTLQLEEVEERVSAATGNPETASRAKLAMAGQLGDDIAKLNLSAATQTLEAIGRIDKKIDDLANRIDCSSATPEQMQLAIAARSTDRVLAMWHCHPENVQSDLVQRQFAWLFNKPEFATARPFMDVLIAAGWNFITDITPKQGFSAKLDNYALSPVFHAQLTGNIDGLNWLAANEPREYWLMYRALFHDFGFSALKPPDYMVGVINLLRKFGVPADFDDYEPFRRTYTSWIETQYPRSTLPSARPSTLASSIVRSASSYVLGGNIQLESPANAPYWKAISDALAPEDQPTLLRVKARVAEEFGKPRIAPIDRDINDFTNILSSPSIQWWRRTSSPSQGILSRVSYAKVPKGSVLQDGDIGNGCNEEPGTDAQCPFYNVKALRDELNFDMRLRSWLQHPGN